MTPSTIAVRVARTEAIAPGLRALTLVHADGAALPSFAPGGHVVVHLPGAPPRRNSYSLASSPSRTDSYRIVVRLDRAGRGGSRALHEQVTVGDRLAIEAPQSLFAPDRTAARHVLVAGGVGITPFISYAHELMYAGTPFELHWSSRTRDSGALGAELAELCPPGSLRVHSGGRDALLHVLGDDILDRQPLGAHLSVCGPAAMIDDVLGMARRLGWPESRLHSERFALEAGRREPFAVELSRSGLVLDVPVELTLLEALEEAGLDVPYLCRQGICGECRTVVLRGVPDHRDDYLTAGDRSVNSAIMPCVSRCAEGPLVLDL